MTNKVNLVFQIPCFGQLLDSVHLLAAVGVSTDDHHTDPIFRVHLSGRLNQEIQSLQWLYTTDVQQNFLSVEAKAIPGCFLIQRTEHGEVHTTWHQRNFSCVSGIQARHSIPFVRAKCDYPVDGCHHLCFYDRSLNLLHFTGPRLHLNEAQSMEGYNVRNVQNLGQFTANPR